MIRIRVLVSSKASFTSGDDTVRGARPGRTTRWVARVALRLKDVSCEDRALTESLSLSISSLSSRPSVVDGAVELGVGSTVDDAVREFNEVGEKSWRFASQPLKLATPLSSTPGRGATTSGNSDPRDGPLGYSAPTKPWSNHDVPFRFLGSDSVPLRAGI